MSKHEPVSDPSVCDLIHSLAEHPSRAVTTRRASRDMARLSLTKRGVCLAICEYLEDGKLVEQTVTDMARGHVGEIAYVLYPTLEVGALYVKLSIGGGSLPDTLTIISVHE